MPQAVLDTTGTLDRNLAALSRCSPAAADLIRGAAPGEGIEFFETAERLPSGGPALSGSVRSAAGPLLLASRRRPIEEAERLAASVPVESVPGLVVMGFGMGYHVRALAGRMGRTGVVFVYEPDVALLRTVLERVDHSDWITRANLAIFTDPEDGASLSAAIAGCEGLLAMGVKFVDHPASLTRLAGRGAAAFRRRVSDAVRAVKTTIVTTLAQSDVTVRNLLMNLDHAVTRPGVADLAGCLAGRPAVVVSAGPSLERNIELLARPGVRDRVAIIAAQTVLKPLLARGIRPHFVTALDYHEISRRFYEGLTAGDVQGVTLIAELKANPAILDAFPGAIRVGGDDLITDLLGEVGARLGSLPAGATVAHMAYYLARHMGCDPVILIGQDLGFTDGQYYAAGAAIHDVWACELNPFNTLEMMEWQRIVRARPILRRAKDVLGRPIYTDDQMATYHAQFERDFLADSKRGLTTIDATEGGVAKAHTTPMPLSEALARCTAGTPIMVPPTAIPTPEHVAAMKAWVREKLAQPRRELWEYAQISRRTGAWLEEMREHQRDQMRVNTLIERVHGSRREVDALSVAPRLAGRLNQIGAFNRIRADRLLKHADDLTPMDRQRQQIERDLENVSRIAEAADILGGMLDEAVRVLDGAPKTTRDPAPDEGEAGVVSGAIRTRSVGALIPVDPDLSGLGTARDLSRPFLGGLNPLRMTVARLARATRLDRIVLLTPDEQRTRALLADAPERGRVEIIATPGPPMGERSRAIRGARLWASACWRGGPGAGTVFDEVVAPAAMADAMNRLQLDGAVIAGADWALIDPALVDAVIDRYLESPGRNRLTFTPAAPGLAPCVMDRSLLNEFSGAMESAGAFASVGGLLGYLPRQQRLRVDPIAGPGCVTVPACVRDVHARLIPDSAPRRELLVEALAPLGDRVLEAGAEEIARMVAAVAWEEGLPRELILELCTGCRTSGVRAAWRPGLAEMIERPPMAIDLARRLIREFAAGRSDAALTFGGAGDPLLHQDLPALVRFAREAGAATHVRTDLVCGRDRVDALLDAGPDVISVDLMADTAATYRALMGADAFEIATGNLEHILARRGRAGGIPVPWLVPRITRCDGVYEEIESFYDRWLTLANAAVIEPLPRTIPGQRIAPLPVPAGAARRAWLGRMVALTDGRVPTGENDLEGENTVADAGKEGLGPAWRKLLAHRRRVAREHGPGHPDLWTGL